MVERTVETFYQSLVVLFTFDVSLKIFPESLNYFKFLFWISDLCVF